MLYIFAVNTFVPPSWKCKKQNAVSHSSSAAGIISLDAGLGMDGAPALQCLECVLSTLTSEGNFMHPETEKNL